MNRSGISPYCGVRDAAKGNPIWVTLCHCENWCATSGTPMVTWVDYRPVDIEKTEKLVLATHLFRSEHFT